MAELEIHHEEEHELDSFGRGVGILAAVLAACLALVTIASHRAHTRSIVVKADANDKWEFYQAQRMKFHNLELGEDLMTVVGSKTDEAAKTLDRYRSEKKRYDEQSQKAQDEAKALDAESERIEGQAFRYDLGEGLLEISVVLSSLYFISRKRLFPAIGAAAGALGIVLALSGLFV